MVSCNYLHFMVIIIITYSHLREPCQLGLQNTQTASLQRGKTSPTSVLIMTLKIYDGEDPVLELWGMWSTPSLPLFPGPLRLRVVTPNRILSRGQIRTQIHPLFLSG